MHEPRSAPEGPVDSKKEGDGKSPAGLFPRTFAFGRPNKTLDVRLPYTKLDNYTEVSTTPLDALQYVSRSPTRG